MSRRINVNPGQYKLRGRERQGEDITPQAEKAEYMKNREEVAPTRKGDKGRVPRRRRP
jgi:hypothetical protein